MDRGRLPVGNINRPGISRALSILRVGYAEALVVSKLDRLSHSLAAFAGLLETAGKQGWGVVAIDTTTPTGELVANIMAAVSRWERQMIGVRTKEGLAVARVQGKRLGSPVLASPETAARIIAERKGGVTLAAIADGLNRDSVPCAGGGASGTRALSKRSCPDASEWISHPGLCLVLLRFLYTVDSCPVDNELDPVHRACVVRCTAERPSTVENGPVAPLVELKIGFRLDTNVRGHTSLNQVLNRKAHRA